MRFFLMNALKQAYPSLLRETTDEMSERMNDTEVRFINK